MSRISRALLITGIILLGVGRYKVTPLEFSIIVEDYDTALNLAALHEQPILLIFYVYGISTRLPGDLIYNTPDLCNREAYIWCELKVDDRSPLGDSTVGRHYSHLQQTQYHSFTQPSYYIINKKEEIMKGPIGYSNREKLEAFIK